MQEQPGDNLEARSVSKALLRWYDRSRRNLPWRAPPGGRPDPYAVWLSEVMLQQTTVKAVIPYYDAFLGRWPDIRKLATAPLEDVLAAWAGLGYYTRARKLHECACAVVERHGGHFPEVEADLLALPGIGPYTAAAIAAIAFDRPATVVDGNVERVVARLFAVERPLPDAKPELRRLAATLTPTRRPGDFAQAMMDLGATICTPRRPACAICPLTESCEGFSSGIAPQLPLRRAKGERPLRQGATFVAIRHDGAVLLRRRPPRGLLGGMLEAPGTSWEEGAPANAKASAPLSADWRRVAGAIRHTFTHFELELTVYRAEVGKAVRLNLVADPDRCAWVPAAELDAAALPSVMRKVLAHARVDA
ncbi:MAG: A/G-specific adenine glycosylase [Pseudomonadota bacterium]|nr:A/G-specific adenine glycosylase [Pseudomonadota bacterium]